MLLHKLYAQPSDSPKYSIAVATNLSATEYSLLTGAIFMGPYLTSALVAGRLGDSRFSRRLVLSTGACLAGSSVVLFSFCTSFTGLACCTFFLGIGTGQIRPSVYSILMDIYPEAYVTRIPHTTRQHVTQTTLHAVIDATPLAPQICRACDGHLFGRPADGQGRCVLIDLLGWKPPHHHRLTTHPLTNDHGISRPPSSICSIS